VPAALPAEQVDDQRPGEDAGLAELTLTINSPMREIRAAFESERNGDFRIHARNE